MAIELTLSWFWPGTPICMLAWTKYVRDTKKNHPKTSAKKPITTYAIGDAKYDFSSF